MPTLWREKAVCIFFFVISLWVFTRALNVHGLEYRDDEIFYFQSTQEMIRSGNFLSPTYFGENRFQKPILFYWLILLSYDIFGIGWTGARWVAALFGAGSVFLTWLTARELFGNRKIAHLSAVILMTVPLFFRHAKNAVPDMPLNFFIVLAMYCALRFFRNPSDKKYSLCFFLSCALGFMIKGFAAFIVPAFAFVFFLVIQRKGRLLKEMNFGRGLLILAMFVSPWFLYMASVHGGSYMDYMLVQETKNRLVGEGGGSLHEWARTFWNHGFFYVKTILSYFAPWSVFFFWGTALVILKGIKENHLGEPLRWLFVWIGVVMVFFSGMHFVINHYMLALTTPFAIVVSYFFLEGFNLGTAGGRIAYFCRKYFILFIFTMGGLAYAFLAIFLAGMAKGWLGIFLIVYAFLAALVVRSRSLLTAPLTLGVFLLCVFAQSRLMDKAGLTAHSALREFAAVISEDKNPASLVGVGSHDIHEKEFQVYFDRKVEKAAASDEAETRTRLAGLFSTGQEVYCLMTEKDFEYYLGGQNLSVVREGYIFRKRMRLDSGFFAAILRLDRSRVHDYLMEKLVLVKKEPHV